MAIRKIRTEGDPILRLKSKEVVEFGPRLYELLDDMKETMKAQRDPGGIAAVQVGVLQRAILVMSNNNIVEMINPKVTESRGKYTNLEGCFSVPGVCREVTRAKHITVEYQNRQGEKLTLSCSDYAAKMILHEIDHLDGILFIDYPDEKKKKG